MREIIEQICWMEPNGSSRIMCVTPNGVATCITRVCFKAMCVTLKHTSTKIGSMAFTLTEVVSVESTGVFMSLKETRYIEEPVLDPITSTLLDAVDAEAAQLLGIEETAEALEADEDLDPTVDEALESLEADVAYSFGLNTPRVSDAEEALALLLSRTH